jgi:hypothetical protein
MLRPRYSLLTLLLLTAAIAVGVKLWRGPHHVVDRTNPQMEDEYTYTRAWDGTPVIDGVRVTRTIAAAGKLANVEADVYRNGTRLAARVTIQAGVYTCDDRVDLETPKLTDDEQHNLAAIATQHLAIIRAQAGKPLLLKSLNISDFAQP